MSVTHPPLHAAGLTKRFGRFTAVENLDLDLEPGTITGFLGPNGAGKSTTLRMAVGLIAATSGEITLFGEPASSPAARKRLGYMPADPAFLPRLSGTDNLDVLAELHGPAGAIDRRELADVLGLTGEELARPVRALSSGMKQKLGLVAALQHRPDLVILDEPANRLDPLVHRVFCELLRSRAADGTTVLLSSHVLGEVEEVCDSIALIKSGRMIRTSTVDAVRAEAKRRVTLRYGAPHPVPASLSDATAVGNVVTGRIPAAQPDVVRQLVADPALLDIEIAPASLEDIVLEMYVEGSTDAGAGQS
ncbi:MAG TPA: ABC transporter ATP-binding protein [Mycobacteriales bacterium]|nr:ABC transporter ATP-binding protein [Mycobacteriales bacterium]